MLSTDEFQAKCISVPETYVVVTAVGTDGGMISDEMPDSKLLFST
jgi:hypothetical protein